MVSSGSDADGVVAVDGAGEDGALHRTGTKLGIVALAGEQVEGGVGEREGDAVLAEHLLHGGD